MIKYVLPVGLSNKHIHLSKNHLDILFGSGYELTKMKDLSKTGQYAASLKKWVNGKITKIIF